LRAVVAYLPAEPMNATRVAAVAALAAVAISIGAAQEGTSGSKSSRDGVYSSAQADRGEKIYKARCGACHMSDQFSGFVFIQSWSGQTADALYENLRTTMPKDNPGVLKPQEYADVIAYLFKINRLPAGDADLKGTKAALKQVIIDAPEK
jgi:mono/diheme cytochrome c family protein